LSALGDAIFLDDAKLDDNADKVDRPEPGPLMNSYTLWGIGLGAIVVFVGLGALAGALQGTKYAKMATRVHRLAMLAYIVITVASQYYPHGNGNSQTKTWRPHSFGTVPGGQWALVLPPLHHDSANETKSFVDASAPRDEWMVLTRAPSKGFPDLAGCSRYAAIYRSLLHKSEELCIKGDLASCTVAKRFAKPVSDNLRCEQSDGGPNFRILIVPTAGKTSVSG
jgi:hypothetical protein